MGIFTNFAVSALMTTAHPTIDRRQCWNLRPHKDRCEDCMKICPKGLFSRAGMVNDWAACVDCGLCVSVCRSRCIAPSGEQVERDVKAAESENDCVWIGCEQSSRHNDEVRDCVGSMTWENLAYLALNKKLVLDLTPCAECKNEICVEHVRKTVRRLADFLGAPLFAARITLAEEADEAPYVAKAYSRREMMEHLTEGSKNSTRQLLRKIPGLKDEERGHALDHRLMLNQRIKQLNTGSETKLRCGWYLPVVTDACYGCGKCERACRAGALKLTTGEDGFTRFVITPWKCSECGQCQRSCTDRAITGMALRQVPTLGPVSLFKFKLVNCPECGKPMKPDSPGGICRVCDSRQKMKKRREEASQRAKERAEQRKQEQAEKEAAEAAAKAAAGEIEVKTAAATAFVAASPAAGGEQAAQPTAQTAQTASPAAGGEQAAQLTAQTALAASPAAGEEQAAQTAQTAPAAKPEQAEATL